MEYTEEYLKNYSGELTEYTFDLINFAHSYEKYISNRRYYYTVNTEDNFKTNKFCIRMSNTHLPHLMALSKKHHCNLPEYQAPKIFKHLKNDWDMNFLETSDKQYFSEFKLRILGSIFLYQVCRLINCDVRIPLAKAHRMNRIKVEFIIHPKNSSKIQYIVEFKTDGQIKNGYAEYFPISLRVNDKKEILNTKSIGVTLVKIDKV